jgi:hypothetical protein
MLSDEQPVVPDAVTSWDSSFSVYFSTQPADLPAAASGL